MTDAAISVIRTHLRANLQRAAAVAQVLEGQEPQPLPHAYASIAVLLDNCLRILAEVEELDK